MITGRIFNPATGEYFRNAQILVPGTSLFAVSEDGGYYRLSNVPPGDVTVTVEYTGYQAAPGRVHVSAGQIATHDFNLISSEMKTSAEGAPLKLAEFVVSADREGNAKAIMDQRRNMNVSNVVASDVFGNIHEDNPGEFLKYLPGVDIEWSADQPRAIRIQGLDPQYTAVTVDGQRVASGDAYVQFLGTTSTEAGDGSRQVALTDLSLSSIESVEVFKTSSADMDADAPAGTVNMRMRRAFDRKGRNVTWQLSAMANSTEFHLKKTYGPDDDKHYKVQPGGSISYSDVFLNNRLGVVATLSRSTSFSQEQRVLPNVNSTPEAADPRPLVIWQLSYQDNPRTSERGSAATTIDFKATPYLALSLRTSYNYSEFRSYNRSLLFQFAANNNTVNGRSTVGGDGLTSVETGGSTAASRFAQNNTGRSFQKIGESVNLSPNFEYKRGPLTVDGRASYSQSLSTIRGIEEGSVSGWTLNNLTDIRFRAERSSPNATDWVIRQTSGPDWNDLSNFKNPRIGDEHRDGKDHIFTVTLNTKYDLPLKFPAWLKGGFKVNEQVRDYLSLFDVKQWAYVGPGGGATGSFGNFPSPTPYHDPFGQMLGITSGLAPTIPNRTAITEAFKAHPEWFVDIATPTQWLNSYIKSNKDYKEQVNAAYLMGFAKLGRFRMQTGLRWEETRTASKEFDPLPLSQVSAAGFPVSATEATTVPGLDYRYRSRPRIVRSGQYDNTFPTFSAKYDFRPNLTAHFGYNQAIQRPGFNHVSGLWAIDEINQRLVVPNPGLLPENIEKYVARLEYYFEPVGQFGIGGFNTNIKNMRETHEFTAQEFGIDDPIYADYTVRTETSGAGTRSIKGYDVDYRQQLAFLPGFLRGTGVFANYTRTLTSARRSGVAPYQVKSGFNFRYRRLSLGANGTWYPETPLFAATTYRKKYTAIAVNGDYKLTKNTSLFFIGKNITNEVEVNVIKVAEGLEYDRQYSHYGAIWTFGVRGTF